MNSNDRLLFAGALLAGLMMGLAYASAPLYTLLCKAVGLGGTTQRVEATQQPHILERFVTVSFDSNVDPHLPWDFVPVTHSVNVRIGEPITAYFRAHNRGKETVTGTATYNVQPDKAGQYFDKIQCFCFTKQTLKPGETVDMAVQFYIDPSISQDPNSDDIKNITLSYSFFLAKPTESDKNSPSPSGNKTNL